MSINEVIESGLLESYVLGITTPEETKMVQELCIKHPELINEIELIEQGLINYASQTAKPLNKELKDSISQRLTFNEPARETPGKTEATIIALKPADSKLKFYKTGIAASILLLITSTVFNVSLSKKVDQLSGQVAELNTTKSILADQMTVQQTSLQTMESNFRFLSDPKVKTIALSGMNSLVSSKAVIHWNPETQEVYFDANALPASPQSKQYQLWAIVDGKPVDAGMISLKNGMAFQKMKQVTGAQAFAVTIENIGGSPTPSIDTMCLLGNV